MGACCVIQAVALLRIEFALSKKGCGRVDVTIDDTNSLNLVAEAIRCVVVLKFAILSVRYQFLPRCDNRVGFLVLSKNQADLSVGDFCFYY